MLEVRQISLASSSYPDVGTHCQMVSCAGTRIVPVLPLRFEPMRHNATEEFYPIQALIDDWESLRYQDLWFDSMHDGLTQLWFDQYLLNLTKNSSWSTVDALVLNRGRAGLSWGSISCRTDVLGSNWLLNRLLNQFSEPVWSGDQFLNRSTYYPPVSCFFNRNQKLRRSSDPDQARIRSLSPGLNPR